MELLLVAVAGCNIVTTEPLTAQRGHRMTKLVASATSEKIERNKLGPVTLAYDVELPEGDADAEKVFRDVAERVEERHCTVSRSLREGTPVNLDLDGGLRAWSRPRERARAGSARAAGPCAGSGRTACCPTTCR